MYAVYFEKLGQREKERLDKAERRNGRGWGKGEEGSDANGGKTREGWRQR